ncbi:MAG: PH domain-containing protein [Bacilli bacterium]|nr:PH domain-containing protein [Bacilli bacterium]
MKIKKKYDVVIALIYLLVLTICGFMIVYPLATMNKIKIGAFDIISIIISTLLILYFTFNYFSINYCLDDKNLIIKSGLSKETLKYKGIMNIKKERKFISTTITSINTVCIYYSPYGKKNDVKRYYLSVKDSEEFINQLKEKCKHLKR